MPARSPAELQPALVDAPSVRPRDSRPAPRARPHGATKGAPALPERTLLDALAEWDEERAEAEAERRLRAAAAAPDRRVLANVAALRMMRALAEEERAPTPAERRVVDRFTPWEVLPNVFHADARYDGVRAELYELLGPDAPDLCRGQRAG